MKNVAIQLIVVALLGVANLGAQQASSTSQLTPTQNQPTQNNTAPCAKPAQPKSMSGFHLRLSPKLQQQFNKQLAQIQNKTGVTVPQVSPDQLMKELQTAHPCPSAPTVSTPQTKTNQ